MITLKTLENALNVLTYFTKEKSSWGVRELAAEMDTSHSTIYRILATFEQYGYLKKNEQTAKYELGIKFIEYGVLVNSKLKIREIIFPIMKRMSNEVGESIFLQWLDGSEAVCLEVAESPKTIKFAVSVGSRTPIYAGASNKVIMAFLPTDKQEEVINTKLKKFTENTVVEPERLREDLKQIREKGFSYTVGEFNHDVIGIAVPLFNGVGDILGSIAVAGPKYRIEEKEVSGILEVIRHGRDEIQANIYNSNLY